MVAAAGEEVRYAVLVVVVLCLACRGDSVTGSDAKVEEASMSPYA